MSEIVGQNCRIDDSDTCGTCYWGNAGRANVIFDPWTSREKSFTTHTTFHTRWAENIHDNIMRGNLQSPALFPEIKGKTVYVVGRGPSLKKAKSFLTRKRKHPAFFLNHANIGFKAQENDWLTCLDERIETTGFRQSAPGFGLVAFPGLPSKFIENTMWRDVRGFCFWNHSPMNDWSARAFPHLPLAIECLTVATTALHFLALSEPKNIVLIGMDFCQYKQGKLDNTKIFGRDGTEVWTRPQYIEMAMATGFFCKFVSERCGANIYTTTPTGLLGIDVTKEKNNKPLRMDWIKSMSLKNVANRFEGRKR